MNRAMKMALMAYCDAARREEESEGYSHRETMKTEDTGARFRDRSGSEHHDYKHLPTETERHESAFAVADHGRHDVTELTEEMAEEWMHDLHNEDGTKGAHWSMEQVKQVMSQKGVKHDLLDFWVVMNSLYADYCSVLKKHNVNNIDFYVDMACAWLDDKDAQEGKTAKYFEYIVE